MLYHFFFAIIHGNSSLRLTVIRPYGNVKFLQCGNMDLIVVRSHPRGLRYKVEDHLTPLDFVRQ